MRTLLLVLLAGALGTAVPAGAQQCNFMCQQQFQRQGAPPWEIQRMCCAPVGPFPAQHPPPQFGQRCSSPGGQCLLPYPGPLGSGCYCATPFGPAGGVVTP